MGEHDAKHRQEHKGGKGCLYHAAAGDRVGDAANLIADHAFANEVREHPVGALHRHVIERFLNAVEGERHDTRIPVGKVAFHRLERIAVFVRGIRQGVKQVVLARETAEHHIGKRNAVSRIYVAKRRVVRIGLQREPIEHLPHVDVHEAGDKLVPLKGNAIRGHGNDDLFFGRMYVFYRDFGALYGVVIEVIFVNVVLHAERCINEAVFIDESKLLERVQLLHLALKRLKMLDVGKVLVFEEANCRLHVPHVCLQVGLDDLLATAGELIEVEHANRAHRIVGGLLRTLPHQPGARDQNNGHHNGTCSRNFYNKTRLTALIHAPSIPHSDVMARAHCTSPIEKPL